MDHNNSNDQKYVCDNSTCEQYHKSFSDAPIDCLTCGEKLTAVEEIK